MDGDWIAQHVEWIASRPHSDGERLTGSLIRRAWPGGHHDRSERAALGWVERWRPTGPRPDSLSCGCASGRCLVC